MKTSAGGGHDAARCAHLPQPGGRRAFLAALAGAALTAWWPARVFGFSTMKTDATEGAKRFTFARLSYPGGGGNPHPSAPAEFIREIERMTSIEAEALPLEVGVADPRFFSLPFLHVSGQRDFPPFAQEHIERLRSWLEAGGTLFVDDAAGTPGQGFDAAIRRELARVLPAQRLERLPAEHTVFKSFFLVRTVTGARSVSPFLEGVTIQGRTAVIYSPNDILGAFARDPLGRWLEPCAPGGERQRRLAFHLGVNIVMYALCGDYKQDKIHLPFLRGKI